MMNKPLAIISKYLRHTNSKIKEGYEEMNLLWLRKKDIAKS